MVTWKTNARVENVRFHPLRFLLYLEVIDTEQKLEIFVHRLWGLFFLQLAAAA